MFSAARTAPLTALRSHGPADCVFRSWRMAGLLGLVAFGPPAMAPDRPRSLYEQVDQAARA